MREVDVAIVGAGIAGLSVARGLVRSGVSVVVIEGRDRIGGRLLSVPVGDGRHRLDLGATWFWPGERRVAQLVRELGVEVHDQHIDGDAMYQASDAVRRLDGNPIDVPASRFIGGAVSLTEGLAADLRPDVVQCGAIVDAVVGTGPFDVHHSGGLVRSQQVVMALPPALAVEMIRFDPPLPEHVARLAAATPVWMGATTKVVALYARPFWRDEGLSGSAISHVGPLREIHDMSGPGGDPAALFGFGQSIGDRAIDVDSAREQLRALFGDAAATPVELVVHDWRAEPMTASPGAESLRAYQMFGHPTYQEPVDRPLHWSSTETSRESPGHIEGALAAAERTVDSVVRRAGVAVDATVRRWGG